MPQHDFHATTTIDGFVFSTDPARMNFDVIHGYLDRSYWSPGVPRHIVEKAAANSLSFGVYTESTREQVGFARVVTDRATFAYLADVFILEPFRARGLSKRLMEFILAHPDLQNLRRFSLMTRDAHGLYARYGFRPMEDPSRYMEIIDRDVYRRLAQRPPSR